jgi:hypothetical protein
MLPPCLANKHTHHHLLAMTEGEEREKIEEKRKTMPLTSGSHVRKGDVFSQFAAEALPYSLKLIFLKVDLL